MLAALLCLLAPAADAPAWGTYRGSPARTACVDGVAAPKSPKVLWAVPSSDHYLASPVPVGANVYLAGLGAFNRPTVSVFPLDAKGMAKPTWSRSAPYLRLASVSSPAVSGNFVVFGDGMHQDAGGILHCLTADTGRPVWQLPMPGELVHLEGAPAISGGRVYMGGGAAGVFCVELAKITLDGKAVTPEEIVAKQEAKWAELQAAYEVAKKRDPDLAVPPNEDQLLKPTPAVAWQVGKEKWHVDAPVNVVGERVLVCTSFLDKEKAGERALYCLDAKTGATLWKQPLLLNPWGGASVLGDTVVVSGSNIGYYYAQLKGAKGDVAAFDLATGKPKWRKEIPGGVVGCVPLAEGLAIATATDGKVRAFNLSDGERRWLYDAKSPIFAPAAVTSGPAGSVIVGDLLGTIHAVSLAQGTEQWKLPLATNPAVKAPGMVYGGPVVQGGKVIVATANLEGPTARKPTAVVCIGD